MTREPRTRVLGGIVLAAAPVVYLIAEAVAAAAWTRPSYSYAGNYISDLGVTGPRETFLGHDIFSPLAWVMNTGFVAYGLLALLGAVLIVPWRAGRRAKAIWILSALLAVGLTLIAFFPGSQLSEQAGTIIFHFVGAPLAIIAGNAVAVVAGVCAPGPRLRRPLIILGVVGWAALLAQLLIMATLPAFPSGIVERLSVYTILAAQLLWGLTEARGRSSAILLDRRAAR
jgi:hypothetical membrane protein